MGTFSKGKDGSIRLDFFVELKPKSPAHAKIADRVVRKLAGNKQLERSIAELVAPLVNGVIARELELEQQPKVLPAAVVHPASCSSWKNHRDASDCDCGAVLKNPEDSE